MTKYRRRKSSAAVLRRWADASSRTRLGTSRTEVEAALTRARDEAQRLADTRSAFLANMSHEIRTPLNAVIGLAQIGRRDYPGTAAGETFATILEAGQLLLSVVNDILDYSKMEAGKMVLERRRFLLDDVIDRAVELTDIPARKELEFRVEEACDLPLQIEGDPRRLVQVLVNLLSNAVKFTETCGRVVLSVSRRPPAEVGEAGSVIFAVTDTGIGMSEEHRLRLFRPFEQADHTTTRRFGGTGLGLSICRYLVEQMGGRITVTSTLGVGSTFEVELPLSFEDAPREWTGRPTVTLFGLRDDEAWLTAALEEREARVTPLTPSSRELPDILVVDSGRALTPTIWAWLERARAAGTRVLVACSSGVARWQVPGVVTISRPLRSRHILSAPDRASVPGGTRRLPGLRVLGIEDDPTSCLVLEGFISGEGARLVCVDDGLSAVDILASQGPLAFDAVLTDISMPGIDGYETARRLRTIAPDLPIIALTAHALPGDRERCLAAGMTGYLTKPVDLDALVGALLPYHRPDLPDGVVGEPGPRRRTAPPAILPSGPGETTDANSFVRIDWSRLERSLPGGAAFVNRLTRVALDTQGRTPALLREAAATRDHAAVRRLAHDFIGTAGAFEMHGVVAYARTTESAARMGSDECAPLACSLADCADAMLELLRERRGTAERGAG